MLRNFRIQNGMSYKKINSKLLLLESLVGRFGSLRGTLLLGNVLDDTNSNGLLHVTDSETPKGRVLLEGFDTHGLAGDHLNDAGIARFDELGGSFQFLTSTPVNLGLEFSKFAGNMGSVAIEDGGISSLDLARVVKDDDLGQEALGFLGWVILGVRGNKTSLQVLDRDVLHVETNVVSRIGLWESFVVHLHGFDLSGRAIGCEGNNHARLDLASLDTTNWDCSNTTNLVHILEWETEGLVNRSGRGLNIVKAVKEGFVFIFVTLPLNLLFLPPGHVVRLLQHVVTMESRNGDNWDCGRVVSYFLDIGTNFLGDFLESVF